MIYDITDFVDETLDDWMTKFNKSSEYTHAVFLPQVSFALPQEDYDKAKEYKISATDAREVEVKIELNRWEIPLAFRRLSVSASI